MMMACIEIFHSRLSPASRRKSKFQSVWLKFLGRCQELSSKAVGLFFRDDGVHFAQSVHHHVSQFVRQRPATPIRRD